MRMDTPEVGRRLFTEFKVGVIYTRQYTSIKCNRYALAHNQKYSERVTPMSI